MNYCNNAINLKKTTKKSLKIVGLVMSLFNFSDTNNEFAMKNSSWTTS
jgi:hypothetical protein